MTLPLDVFENIVDCYSPLHDKNTLYSLSLSSHSICAVALPALWRQRSSLQPIVSVINAFAPPHDPYLSYQKENDGDWKDPSWVLNKPIENKSRLRAKLYLSYIRRFTPSLEFGSDKEPGLWNILAISLDSHVLLPNLRQLVIDCMQVSKAGFSSLTSIISPSPEAVSRSISSDCALLLTTLVGSPLPSTVTAFRYSGDVPERRLIDSITEYRSLITLDLEFALNLESRLAMMNLPTHNTPMLFPIPACDLLSSFPNLLALKLTLDFFPFRCIDEAATSVSRCHDKLRELTLRGSNGRSNRGIPYFFHSIALPNLLDLTMDCQFETASELKTIYELVAERSPRIVHFKVSNFVLPSGEWAAQYRRDSYRETFLLHYIPLCSLPLETLHITDGTTQLTPRDVYTLASSFPRLKSFSIMSPSLHCFDASEDFLPLCRLPQISYIELDELDLNSLIPRFGPSNNFIGDEEHRGTSALETLVVGGVREFPETQKGLITLAKWFSEHVPRLAQIKPSDRRLCDDILLAFKLRALNDTIFSMKDRGNTS